MVAFEWVLGPAIDAGVSVAFQHDAAHDVPVIGRQPLPVKGTNMLVGLCDARLNGPQQWQDGQFDILPLRGRQARDLRQADIAHGTAYPSFQKQQPQRPMLMRGKVERVGEIVADIEISVGLVQGLNVRECHGFRISVTR